MFLRNLVVTTFFTALMYVIGLIPNIQMPFLNVPIIIQNIGVFLAASILGIVGVFSVILLLILAALGLPVLTGGIGGYSIFLEPMGGFLLGYILAAFIIGLLVHHSWPNIGFTKYFIYNIIGLIVLYLSGALWYSYNTINAGVPTPFINALFIFLAYIPGDIIKIIITCYVAVKIKKYYPMIEKKDIEDYTDEHSKRQLINN